MELENVKTIDIVKTSASRPEFLKESLPTMLKYLKFDGKLRWLLHEDVLNKEGSEECLEYVKSLNLFDVILISDPPIGQGYSINALLKHVNAKYFIHWEDDYIATRELDLNMVYKVLEENPDVLQIAFNKRPTVKHISGMVKKTILKSGQELSTSPHWRFTPAIWRTDFTKKNWLVSNTPNFNWIFNDHLKKICGIKKGYTADDIIDRFGVYYLGGISKVSKDRYTYHIGGGKSLRLKDYKWGDNK